MKNQDLREFLTLAIKANSSEAEDRALSQSELSMVVADFVEEAILGNSAPIMLEEGKAILHFADHDATKYVPITEVSVKHRNHGLWGYQGGDMYLCPCGYVFDPFRNLEWPPKPECPESPDGHHDSCPWSPDSNNVVVVFCAQCRLDLFQFLLPEPPSAFAVSPGDDKCHCIGCERLHAAQAGLKWESYTLCDSSEDGYHVANVTRDYNNHTAHLWCLSCRALLFTVKLPYDDVAKHWATKLSGRHSHPALLTLDCHHHRMTRICYICHPSASVNPSNSR